MFQQFENVAYCIVDLLYFFTTKTEIQSPFERLARFFLPNVYTKGIDCILSRFKLIKLSLSTNIRGIQFVYTQSLWEYHILIITKLDILPADCPILNVITIVYGHYPCSLYKFPNKDGS
jgi:hypothetical protein